jgi:hypothetical protein
MAEVPILLTSCTRCRRLHVPLTTDASNPICARCVAPLPVLPPAGGRGREHPAH